MMADALKGVFFSFKIKKRKRQQCGFTQIGARKHFPSATNVKQIDDEGQEKYYPTSVHKNIFIFKVHTRLTNGVFLFFFSF